MIIVVDTNIKVSASVDSKSELFSLIIDNSTKIDFVTPEFSLKQIQLNRENICRKAKKYLAIFKSNLQYLLSHITVLSDDELTETNIQDADNLSNKIDMDDTIFIAFSLALNCLLWSGDRHLMNGVKRAGFQHIISTKEFKDILKGL